MYAAGQSFTIEETFPGHCASMLHMIEPYLFTFANGGFFPWVRKKGQAVIACPGDTNNCIALLEHTQGNKIDFVATEIKGKCPFYSQGKRYTIDATHYCIKLATVSLLYADRKQGTRFRCPGGCGTVVSEIL